MIGVNPKSIRPRCTSTGTTKICHGCYEELDDMRKSVFDQKPYGIRFGGYAYHETISLSRIRL